jgi:hypothetical protein
MPDHHLSEDSVMRSAEAFLRVDYTLIWAGSTTRRENLPSPLYRPGPLEKDQGDNADASSGQPRPNTVGGKWHVFLLSNRA